MKLISYLGCVAEKYTKKQLSPVFEFTAINDYHAVDALQELSGIKINGTDNYADLLHVETV